MTTTSAFDSTLSSLGITRTATTGSTASTTNSSGITYDSSGNQVLGQSDFLKLMTAQMQNQDPFNPTDNTQMVAQMAQFSTLSATTDMDTTLKSIATKLTGTSTSDALSYVGKNVQIAGNTAYPTTSGTVNGSVQVGGAASDVSVSIQDSSGQVLKTLDLGAQSAGNVDYTWDGTTASGASAGSGPFTIVTNATSSTGGSVSTQNLVWAPVESVTMSSSGNPTLNVTGVGSVAPSSVLKVG